MSAFLNGKKVLINLPIELIDKIDGLAIREHYNRSELVRQAVREFCDRAEVKHGPITPYSHLPIEQRAERAAISRLGATRVTDDTRGTAYLVDGETSPGAWRWTEPANTKTIMD